MVILLSEYMMYGHITFMICIVWNKTYGTMVPLGRSYIMLFQWLNTANFQRSLA
jgi:hypothetical protein